MLLAARRFVRGYRPLSTSSAATKIPKSGQIAQPTEGEFVQAGPDGSLKASSPILKAHATLYRKALMMKHQVTSGSLYTPLNIEPQYQERLRLDASLGSAPMNDQQRSLRRQWVEDQWLAPDEPRYVPALYKTNIFTRMFQHPWDWIAWRLRPLIGHNNALGFRMTAPKILFACFLLWMVLYNILFGTDWDYCGGWKWAPQRPVLYPGEPGWEEAKKNLHNSPEKMFDQGFSKRTVFLSEGVQSSFPTTHDPEFKPPRGPLRPIALLRGQTYDTSKYSPY